MACDTQIFHHGISTLLLQLYNDIPGWIPNGPNISLQHLTEYVTE